MRIKSRFRFILLLTLAMLGCNNREVDINSSRVTSISNGIGELYLNQSNAVEANVLFDKPTALGFSVCNSEAAMSDPQRFIDFVTELRRLALVVKIWSADDSRFLYETKIHVSSNTHPLVVYSNQYSVVIGGIRPIEEPLLLKEIEGSTYPNGLDIDPILQDGKLKKGCKYRFRFEVASATTLTNRVHFWFVNL